MTCHKDDKNLSDRLTVSSVDRSLYLNYLREWPGVVKLKFMSAQGALYLLIHGLRKLGLHRGRFLYIADYIKVKTLNRNV